MALEFINISHRYKRASRDEWRMSDVSLTANAGEIICLFGPSGCGKTTLLRLAAGLEPLQQGQILLDGAPLSGPGVNLPPEQRPVGLVFQDYVLFPHLEVSENIGFGLAHLSRKDRMREAEKRMEMLRIRDLAKRYPNELSGGQQQRVALARALARKPKAMLLDEPFASLGSELRRSLQEEMRRILKDDACAAIFVTHDPQEALLMGDRIALMDQGRVIEIATPQSLYEAPQTFNGAMMHEGAQALRGIIQNDRIETAFGMIPPPLSQLPRPDRKNGERVTIVLGENAVHASDAKDSPLIVKDCRFLGPDWILFLTHETSGETLRVPCSTPLLVGQRAKTRINPEKIRLIVN